MVARPRPKRRSRPPAPARKKARHPPAAPRFVGREGSPVLDRYPPKDPSLTLRGPPPSVAAPLPAAAPKSSPAAAPASAPPSGPLIGLDRPFDPDEFAELLGETQIRVEVPRENLADVLRRIADFMGFGIYVYRFSVRPAPSEMLRKFVVELQRVDYAAAEQDWVQFRDRGRAETPFGPSPAE